jgi:hypothetical protein
MITRRNRSTSTGGIVLGCFAILVFVVLVTLGISWLFMVAWNIFVFGVLGLTREISLWEAFIGVVLLELIGSAFRAVVNKT